MTYYSGGGCSSSYYHDSYYYYDNSCYDYYCYDSYHSYDSCGSSYSCDYNSSCYDCYDCGDYSAATYICEDFGGICDPDDSYLVQSDDCWDIYNGAAYADGYNDGALILNTVQVSGVTTLSFDVKTLNIDPFESNDEFIVYASVDGGNWIVLDTFTRQGNEFVGNITGQTYGESAATLYYTVGDAGTSSVQFAMVADFSYYDETVLVDNVCIEAGEDTPGDDCEGTPDVDVTVDFEGVYNPDDEALVSSDDNWYIKNGKAKADGYNDGALIFDKVEVNGVTEVSFDIKTKDISPFETSDNFCVYVYLEGNWVLLDTFRRDGNVFRGDQTGQTYGESFTQLNYTVGDDTTTEIYFAVVADFSYCDETVIIDNVRFFSEGEECAVCDTKETFDSLAAGTVVSDQFDGFTVTAQRAGDSASSENDAMIFDAENTTGGDGDLGFNGKGKIIIISEDNDSSDPDDNYGGGTITFDFDNPSKVTSLELLDIEENGGTIDLFDASGALIKTVAIPATGNNTANTVAINAEGVASMNVNLVGSGAINDLCFEPGEFVDPMTGELRGRYFCDENDNDVDDAEPGIGGIEVILTDGNGTEVARTTTAADGSYEFLGLAGGDYVVTFAADPTGKTFVADNVGSDDTVDSDVTVNSDGTASTGVITLPAGGISEDNDAGVEDPGTAALSGRYFCDENDDSIDNNEPGIGGIEVILTDGNGTEVARTTTAADGSYEFLGLGAGDYVVTFAADPTGKTFVDANVGSDDTVDSDVTVNSDGTASTGTISLAIGEVSTDNDAGVEDPGTAELGNLVFFDANKDGIFDTNDGDYGLADIEVTLLDGNGNTVATQTTNANGNYLFTGLNAGTYQVGFTAAAGLVFTTEGALSGNADDADNDSDADVLTGLTDLVDLSIGESELDIDAGLYVPNTAPVADDETAMTCADEAVTVDVLDGDTDADGDLLTITEVDGQAITEGGSVTTSAGTVVTLIGGQLVFDGETAYAGLDIGEQAVETIAYTIDDGQGGTDTGAVEVTFCGDANSYASLAATFPVSGSYQVADSFANNPFGDFAYDLLISGTGNTDFDGVVFEQAYCLSLFDPAQGGADFASAPIHTADFFAAEGADALGVFNPASVSIANGQAAADNLDLINYVIAQDYENQGFSAWDVQMAIWELTDQFPSESFAGLPGLSDANVDIIVNDALANGEGFTFADEGMVAFIIDPNPATASNSQPFIVTLDFEAYDCLC